MHVLLLQEIVTEPGVFFLEDHGWVVVFGKNADDWRGTAIAYKASARRHVKAPLSGDSHHHSQQQGEQGRQVQSGAHTAPRDHCTDRSHPGGHGSRPSTKRESFWGSTPTREPDGEGWRAHTGRGEVILEAVAKHGLQCPPPQNLDTPSYHPYNTALRQRRLDYILHKGNHIHQGGFQAESRHMARSDHDLVWVAVGGPTPSKAAAPFGGADDFGPMPTPPKQPASHPHSQIPMQQSVSSHSR